MFTKRLKYQFTTSWIESGLIYSNTASSPCVISSETPGACEIYDLASPVILPKWC